jgi:hypothetical protein
LAIPNKMSDLQLYTKLVSLPPHQRAEVADFIEFLSQRNKKELPKHKRVVFGMAKGLIAMKDNFDDPIDGFEDYMP